MLSKNIKAVIFDMDGLMIDTEKLLVKYWCRAANEYGFPMQEKHALSIRSLARKYAIPRLQGWFGDEFDYVKIRTRRMELMQAHIDKYGIEKKAGLDTLLQFLKQNNFKVAVATATDYQRAEKYLKSIGVFDFFDRIVCATMVENGKPKPDIYIYASKQLGLKPQECIALEDSPNGIMAGFSAGCKTIMIPDLTQPDDELKAMTYAVCDRLDLVIDVLKRQ